MAKAKAALTYAKVYQADARALPFEEGEFQSVIAVSVLEHIPDPWKVVAEVYRVLRPGGRFLGTVLLADFHEHLFYPRLLRGLGMPGLARRYVAIQDRYFGHQTLLSKEGWERMFRQAGFEIAASRRIVSPAVTRCWDFFLATAWASQVASRWGVFPLWCPGWLRVLLRKAFFGLVQAEEVDGSDLLFLLQKPPVSGIAR